MASELLRTPVLEVRWCQLLGDARDNKFDPTKAPTWQVEGVAPSNNPEAVSFVELMEGKFEELHPGEKKHTYWLPIKPDKEDPTIQLIRFKLSQFTYKDGNKSQGPVVYDSEGGYWPAEKLIGNGSKMRIGFDIYGWKAPTGCGLTFQPRAAQVIEWLAAPTNKPTSAADFGFDVKPNTEAKIPF